VAPENLAIFTATTLKPRFCDWLQSASKPHETERRRKERERSLNDGKKKPKNKKKQNRSNAPVQISRPWSIVFKNPGICVYYLWF